MPERSWAERIPAAIEKAEKLRACEEAYCYLTEVCEYCQQMIKLGPDVVALAKALWVAEERIHGEWGLDDQGDDPPSPALRAFCEKVEAL